MTFSLSKICKNYGKKVILKDVSLSANAGECIALLGENGSGKSTLISILSGVLKPDSGDAFIDEEKIFQNKKIISKTIGYVPQQNPLIEELSALDNLKLWYSKTDLQESLQNGMLKLLGIPDFLKRPVSKLSGGMKKRLSIGCAIAKNPKILLLDEPTAALDIICKETIYNYCRNFVSNGGILILATHEISELEFCSRCYILKQGTLIPYDKDKNLNSLLDAIKKWITIFLTKKLSSNAS